MKKLLLVATIALLPMMANAHDSTGCGLGSMAWRGQKGVVPQVLAATTNGFFGTQTFGISSGTSGKIVSCLMTGATGAASTGSSVIGATTTSSGAATLFLA